MRPLFLACQTGELLGLQLRGFGLEADAHGDVHAAAAAAFKEQLGHEVAPLEPGPFGLEQLLGAGLREAGFPGRPVVLVQLPVPVGVGLAQAVARFDVVPVGLLEAGVAAGGQLLSAGRAGAAGRQHQAGAKQNGGQIFHGRVLLGR